MKIPATSRKLRGGYYTPQPIADFIAKWAIKDSTSRVLEPSCGDGMLLGSAIEVLAKYGATPARIRQLVQGVEYDTLEAQKAYLRVKRSLRLNGSNPIHSGDFFSYCQDQLDQNRRFDAIIGNPPFIRYQSFPEDQRSIAFELMRQAGLHPNRLTNSWVPFIAATTLLLDNHGRLGMVVPAELLQVNYAAELRQFLSQQFSYITLVTFKKLVFEGIQQEIVILLAEKNGKAHTGIQTVELDGLAALVDFQHKPLPKSRLKEMDHSSEKWTMYFLDEKELALMREVREHPKLTKAGEVLDVDVGIVTGQNDFFVLTQEKVREHHLQDFVQPLVGRSAHLQGSIFSNSDWDLLVERQSPAFLLNLPAVEFGSLPINVQNYIRSGEARNMHTGFKCRNRKPWYSVPSIWEPDAFMLRQVHSYPKIILNDTRATCTDTIHRVKVKSGAHLRTSIAAGFLNSLTFAFAEITGRSYGGGVLEIEPNEAERLLLPLEGSDRINMYEVDKMLRQGEIENALANTDKILLRDGLGLTAKEANALRAIWRKLRDRRINRKPERN